jgi:5-formyltetrahydrofolate cyclo-ligase
MEQEAKVSAEKAAWRERFRAARAAMPGDARAAASRTIVEAVDALCADARVVSLFWPLVGRAEVDVRPLVARLTARGAVAALPAVVGKSPPTLVHRAVAWEADLVAGPWGLAEPSDACPLVPPGAVDVAVVPALGLGRDGSRIGYGGGYYDAFLAGTRARLVGVVWDACLVDALPTEAFDVPLDVIVTERGTLSVAAGRRTTP